MECECLEACPFFNDRMKNMPSFSSVLKQQFCRGDCEACARHRVFKRYGREAVPPDLFPDEHERADAILNQCQVPRPTT